MAQWWIYLLNVCVLSVERNARLSGLNYAKRCTRTKFGERCFSHSCWSSCLELFSCQQPSMKLTTDTNRLKKLLKSHRFHIAFWHFVSVPGQFVSRALQIPICICICYILPAVINMDVLMQAGPRIEARPRLQAWFDCTCTNRSRGFCSRICGIWVSNIWLSKFLSHSRLFRLLIACYKMCVSFIISAICWWNRHVYDAPAIEGHLVRILGKKLEYWGYLVVKRLMIYLAVLT